MPEHDWDCPSERIGWILNRRRSFYFLLGTRGAASRPTTNPLPLIDNLSFKSSDNSIISESVKGFSNQIKRGAVVAPKGRVRATRLITPPLHPSILPGTEMRLHPKTRGPGKFATDW